jgi:type IV pilus assembly protein PilB
MDQEIKNKANQEKKEPDQNNDSAYIKIDLSSYLIDEELLKSVPGALVKKYLFMPVFKIGNTLTIATTDPENLEALDNIKKALGTEIDALYADREDIQNAIDQHYGMMDLIENYISEASEDKAQKKELNEEEVVDISSDQMADSSIVNLVNLLISQSLLKRASDIHIEPLENEVLVRIRVDGEMQEMKRLPKTLLSAIVSRIKVMSGMDIAESRLPQDGHIKMTVEKTPLEIRVSSLPMICGENLVLRLLAKGENIYSLTDIGFDGKILQDFEKLISAPYGIVLVTGPTGSGKTTTLYAALDKVNQTSKNIITLEDPVESQIPMIRQVQINERAGLLFSTGLRSILRQDPDIIMVGEIRDLETVELAIRSALTGHLVFSTVHTNDAPSTLVRLVDMGVEPFLVSSSVIGVLAQRLVRKVCPKCAAPYTPTKDELDLLGLDPKQNYKKGKGCKSCGNTGYLGRTGIFELLNLDEKVKQILVKRASAAELRKLALENGMKSMQEDALEKIYAGLTTPEEVLKVVRSLR